MPWFRLRRGEFAIVFGEHYANDAREVETMPQHDG